MLVIAVLALGCRSPVRVVQVDPRSLHRALTRNVLSTGELSEPSVIVFARHDLAVALAKEPEDALAALREVLRGQAQPQPDTLFALAEASFQHAEDGADPAHYRAAALYAYAFLFPGGGAPAPSPYDRRYRLACDLYNRGLTAGFRAEDGVEALLRGSVRSLPFGTLAVTFDESQLVWGERRLVNFVPVAELEVRGLTNRYRQQGIGAPLSADAEPAPGTITVDDFLPKEMKLPSNAFLRIDDPRRQIVEQRIEGVLELRIGYQRESVEVSGREVPLELETTSSLALMLENSSVWDTEYAGFLFGDLTREETRLVGMHPYLPGRTPVVLVHGTASSAGRWANMLNDLVNDPRIREEYQFWFYSYDTGNPVSYSALLLRESLADAVQRFDPDGADPALREMVLVGHSQGGLLVKLAAVETGDHLWRSASRVPIDSLKIEPETRELIEKAMFVEPQPYVGRVVFIATPHRGSFRAANRLAHWLGGLVKLPSRLGRVAMDVLSNDPSIFYIEGLTRLPSSVDNMTPGHPFVEALADLPVSDGIPSNSIIAVKGDGPVESGNDGMVEYSSAHIDEAESELVVRSHHSVQDHPDAIEEVRRILLHHRGIE